MEKIPPFTKIDGNKKGSEGEDILPMMRPVNPNIIADAGKSKG